MSKIMQVFYGTDLLPYKDQARSVHYPIVGSSFIGASNTTEIRFYIDQIGNYEDTWVANSKLPNGKMGNEILTSGFDEEFNEHYVKMTLSTFYTQAKGNLFISLNGFIGGVQIVEQDGIYTIQGTPTIQATGSVKIAINYATPLANGDELSQITLQQILSEIATKLPKNSSYIFKAISSIDNINTSPSDEYFVSGDIVIDTTTKRVYQLSGTYPSLVATEIELDLNNLSVRGNLTVSNFASITNGSQTLENYVETKVSKTNTANRVYGTDNSGNQTTIAYSASGTAASGTIVSRATGGHILIPYIPTQENAASSKSYTDSFGKSLEVSIDSSTYVMTLVLKAGNGSTLSTQTVDLPLESMVVGGSYDDTTEELVLLLNNGNEIRIPVSDLVSGLVSETDLQTALSNYFTKSEINTILEDYAKVDGNFPTMSVGKADVAENLETNLGASVDNAVGVLAPISVAVEDDDFAKMNNVKGRSFVYNQLVNENNESSQGISYIFAGNNEFTFSGTASTSWSIFKEITVVAGHKYFVSLTGDVNNFVVRVYNSSNTYRVVDNVGIITIGQNETFIIPRMNYLTAEQSYSGKIRIYLIDLTQCGINATTVDEAISALRSYGIDVGIYNEYSTGKIIDTQPNKIVSVGFNQWDEEWEVGSIDNNGVNITGSNVRSKNYIPVIPNTTYYFYATINWNNVFFYDKNKNFINTLGSIAIGTFEVPNNACYMRFRMNSGYGTIYNNDICINISNASLNGTYKSFVKNEYVLDLPVMRSAGNVADDKELVRVGSVDLGTLDYFADHSNNRFYTTGLSSLIKLVSSGSVIGNISCSIYIANSVYNILDGQSGIGVSNNGTVSITDIGHTNDDAATFKQAMSGVILNYELATPTEQESISLPENIRVFNGGTLNTEYQAPNTTPALISMLYQINIKSYVEGQGARTDINWTPSNVVSQTELANAIDEQARDIRNGQIIAGKSQLADNLTPYSEYSGASQSNPFISNGTGTNNNQEIVTVGVYGLLRSKNGNSIVVNQLYNWSAISKTEDNVSVSVENGKIKIVVSGERTNYVVVNFNSAFNKISGHTYLFNFNESSNLTSLIGYNNATGLYISQSVPAGSGNFAPYGIQTSTASGSCSVSLVVGTSITTGTYYISPIYVDLTQMFNGNIPQDLLDNPSHFSWYYNGSLAYNTGTLVNANGVKLLSTGRNLWDEETESGGLNLSTGAKINDSTAIRSKNYIRVIPNTTYFALMPIQRIAFYDKDKNYISYVATNTANTTFTTPNNACYILFYVSGTTYQNNITISLYYTEQQGGEGYSNYYPYQTPYEVDTGNEVLRSAGSVYDYKEHNGTIHRRIGSYTFTGSESWNIGETYSIVNISDIISIAKLPQSNGDLTNIISSFATRTTANQIYLGNQPNGIAISSNGTLWVGNGIDTTSLVGKTIYFELATETIEQGTSFAENLPINDYGMLYWDSDIPQGNTIFFPINYKGFVDDMYSRVDGDSSKYVIDTQLSASETQRDTIDTQLKNAIGGTLRQCLCVKATLSFENTDVVDLGTITYTYDSTNGYFYGSLNVAKNSSTSDTGMCSKYRFVIGNNVATNLSSSVPFVSISAYRSTTNNLIIRDTSYTDANTFKNAMKGVLLAYEKA